MLESCGSRLAARLPGRGASLGTRLADVLGGLVVLAAFLWSYWPTVTDLWRNGGAATSTRPACSFPSWRLMCLGCAGEDLHSYPVRPALWLGRSGLSARAGGAGRGLDLYSFAERFSLVLSLAAVVLLVLGWQCLAKLAPVLLFLCLMLPWPHRVQGLITLPLQSWSTTSAVFCLETVGYEIQQDGNQITIGSASFRGGGLQRPADDYGLLCDQRVGRAPGEAGLVGETGYPGLSLPIAFLCNTLRLAVTAVFFTIIKTKAWEQWFHDWGGYAMMPLALALVVGELWLLARLTTPSVALEPAIVSRRHPPHLPDLNDGSTGRMNNLEKYLDQVIEQKPVVYEPPGESRPSRRRRNRRMSICWRASGGAGISSWG